MECPDCGWPDSELYEVVSTHATSQGWVRYLRCPCGRLAVQVHPRYTLREVAPSVVATPSEARQAPAGPLT
jgi:hypothetical protein